MNRKLVLKIVLDLLMTILLLVLMARQITVDTAHEWLGAGMMILWITHHILNRRWYGNLFKALEFSRSCQLPRKTVILEKSIKVLVNRFLSARKQRSPCAMRWIWHSRRAELLTRPSRRSLVNGGLSAVRTASPPRVNWQHYCKK